MKTNKNLLAVAAIIACCAIVAWFSTSIHGNQNTYELQPRISLPEYSVPAHKTDAVRIMDAYERLMDRYMDLTERNSVMVGTDLAHIAVKLDAIDGKLADISARTARIEKALGIQQPAAQVGSFTGIKTNRPDIESVSKSPR